MLTQIPFFKNLSTTYNALPFGVKEKPFEEV
jgi:hypothetical protein